MHTIRFVIKARLVGWLQHGTVLYLLLGHAQLSQCLCFDDGTTNIGACGICVSTCPSYRKKTCRQPKLAL